LVDRHPVDARATFIAPHLLHASFKFARSHTSSIIRLVLAGRSGSFTAESDSMSSRPAFRASPVGVDEKSSLDWMFSRLSLSRFTSYLPPLSFGPSATVPGSAYLLTPPFGPECLTSLADDMTHLSAVSTHGPGRFSGTSSGSAWHYSYTGQSANLQLHFYLGGRFAGTGVTEAVLDPCCQPQSETLLGKLFGKLQPIDLVVYAAAPGRHQHF